MGYPINQAIREGESDLGNYLWRVRGWLSAVDSADCRLTLAVYRVEHAIADLTREYLVRLITETCDREDYSTVADSLIARGPELVERFEAESVIGPVEDRDL